MKAIIKSENQNAVNYGGKKETVRELDVVGKIDGNLRAIVTARFYMGRSSSASTVYCALWVHGKGIYTSGKGQAGGYGYHKESAALSEAIKSAGIELFGDQYADSKGMVYRDFPNPDFNPEYANTLDDEEYKQYMWRTSRTIRKLVREDLKKKAYISGVGDSAMECALIAIAKAAGGRGKMLIA